MNLQTFMSVLDSITEHEELLDFSRKFVLHGTPYIFIDKDDDFYEFRKVIANKFRIPFHEVYVTGSGKLGFSPYKSKEFDYDSDIDIAIISPYLFETIMRDISAYQMKFRKNRTVVSQVELKMYHEFLEYVALGWIRPDKLPVSFQMRAFKDDWFDFFQSLSYGRSQVGNYKVNAGVFKSYQNLEEYIVSGLQDLKSRRTLRSK